jgi:hypothetical protein
VEQYEVPKVVIANDEDEFTLDWFNTRVRTFEDNQFDHIEHRVDERLKGIRVGRAVMDLLFDLNFPMQYDPVVDQSTFEWFIEAECRVLNQELNSLDE